MSLDIGHSGVKGFCPNLESDNIRVMAQPLGSFFSASVDIAGRDLAIAKDYPKANLMVLDPGFGTFDVYNIRQGMVMSAETFDELGMKEIFRRTANDILEAHGQEISIPAMQNLLEKGKISVMDRKIMKR